MKQRINGKEVTVDRIEDLVATLNDLFGKFDDAADVRRIILFFFDYHQTYLQRHFYSDMKYLSCVERG